MIFDTPVFWRFLRTGLAPLLFAAACLVPSSQALAQGLSAEDLGDAAGTACMTVGSAIIVNIGEGAALPGQTAPVPVSISNTDDNNVSALGMDFFFPTAGLTLAETGGCVIAQRLATTHSLAYFINPAIDPCATPAGASCVRFIITSLQRQTFGDGDLMTCNFGVQNGIEIGTVLDLIADASTLQITNNSLPPQCLEPTEAEDGSVTVQEPFTPTATATATPIAPTATNTGGATPTNTHGATPTNTGPTGPTNTPTKTSIPGTPTNTPVPGTPTATRSGGPGTPTNTPMPGTATKTPLTPIPTPTRTRTGGTPPSTNTPGGGNDNGLNSASCAITPAAQANSWHSLVLLAVPAILLAARRRRRP